MNMKTATPTLAMLLTVAGLGAHPARTQAQDDLDATTDLGEPAPSTTSSSMSSDAPPSDEDAQPPAETGEPPDEASTEPSPYDDAPDESASMDASDEADAPPPEPKGMRLLWGVQLGYMFPTDPQPPFRAAKWMPIGVEVDFGLGKSPFAIVAKVDGSPFCFGGDDCSGFQVRGLAGLEVGIQKAADSLLHMVYFNASLGYRYAQSKISVDGGTEQELKENGMLVSEVSASMMLRVSRNLSLGPRAALSSNLTGDTPEGVSAVQLGLRVLHAPGR